MKKKKKINCEQGHKTIPLAGLLLLPHPVGTLGQKLNCFSNSELNPWNKASYRCCEKSRRPSRLRWASTYSCVVELGLYEISFLCCAVPYSWLMICRPPQLPHHLQPLQLPPWPVSPSAAGYRRHCKVTACTNRLNLKKLVHIYMYVLCREKSSFNL